MPRTAAMSLEIMYKHSPKDKDLAIETATALAEVGETSRAEKLLVDLLRLSPNDNDLALALKNAAAKKTLNEGGYDDLAGGEGSYRDILKDKQEAVSLEQEQRVQKSDDVAERLIREYELRLKTEPRNFKMLRSLAELYTQKKQFEHALECYRKVKASDIGGSDPTLDRAIAETIVRRYDHQVEQLDPAAADFPEQLARINEEKIAYQVEECQKRVEKFPTDLLIRFEMGLLYFQAGKISEAIQEFQKAQANPHKRIASMNYLGQCYARRKMHDLAARAFQNALKEKTLFDDEKKDLIYNLGCVLESMGKKEEAIEQLKQIYEVDIAYKDVAAKVDAYYAGQ
jgi:tetratricopeptide (TPR) repeat protein